jgi:hypothetical protein
MMVQRGPLDFIARSVVFQPSGLSGGTATGDITLKDGTGNSAAYPPTVDIGALETAGPDDATTPPSPGSPLEINVTPDVQLKEKDVTFNTDIAQAVALITNLQVEYGDNKDNHVKKIEVGAPSAPTIDGAKVKLWKDTGARISDNPNHSQDDNVSSVTMVVIGVPPSA